MKKGKPAAEKNKAIKAKVEKGVAASEKAEKPKPEKAAKAGKEVKKETGGKEKVEKVSGDEAEKLILGYLKEQNRPYSATEISANLHGKVCFFPSLPCPFPIFILQGSDLKTFTNLNKTGSQNPSR